MTLDEQKSITEFVTRSVTVSQPLDVEADAIIRALFVRNPDAAYRITMLAMAQEARLNGQAGHVCAPPDQAKAARGWLETVLKRDAKPRQARARVD